MYRTEVVNILHSLSNKMMMPKLVSNHLLQSQKSSFIIRFFFSSKKIAALLHLVLI